MSWIFTAIKYSYTWKDPLRTKEKSSGVLRGNNENTSARQIPVRTAWALDKYFSFVDSISFKQKICCEILFLLPFEVINKVILQLFVNAKFCSLEFGSQRNQRTQTVIESTFVALWIISYSTSAENQREIEKWIEFSSRNAITK